MLTMILTRHGETDLNLKGMFRGRLEVDLNETGLRQATLLAHYLRGVGVTAIYSSPLRRAVKTAEIVSRELDITYQESPELTDLDYGEWQGLAHATVKERSPGLYAAWIRDPQATDIPGGESLAAVSERVRRLIDALSAQDGATILLISHRAVNRVIMCYLLGLDNSHFWNFGFNSCALTTFTYGAYGQRRFILVSHNDACFLGGEGT